MDRDVPAQAFPAVICLQTQMDLKFDSSTLTAQRLHRMIFDVRSGSLAFRLCQALSYTWGDLHLARRITVDQHDFSVRENLYRFLKEFQKNHLSKDPIWMDQICINQADNVERSRQVQQMLNA